MRRRDFLKLLGLSAGAPALLGAALTAPRTPYKFQSFGYTMRMPATMVKMWELEAGRSRKEWGEALMTDISA